MLKYVIKLSLFYFFSWPVHIVVVSIISFFHFRLNHQLIVIENWIFDYSWQTHTVSKIISFFLFFKFFLGMSTYSLLERVIYTTNKLPSLGVVILCLMNLAFILYIGTPERYENVLFSYQRLLFHSVTIIGSFFVDLMVLEILEDEISSEINPCFKILVISLIVFIYMLVTLFHGWNLSILLLFLLFLNFSYYFLYENRFMNSIIFSLLVVSPLFSIFGFDPVWTNKYSLYIFKNKNIEMPLIVLVFVSILYRYYIIKTKELK